MSLPPLPALVQRALWADDWLIPQGRPETVDVARALLDLPVDAVNAIVTAVRTGALPRNQKTDVLASRLGLLDRRNPEDATYLWFERPAFAAAVELEDGPHIYDFTARQFRADAPFPYILRPGETWSADPPGPPPAALALECRIGPEHVSFEDGRKAMIVETEGDAPDPNLFVRLQSWDETGRHDGLTGLVGRRVRITVDVLGD